MLVGPLFVKWGLGERRVSWDGGKES